MSHASSAPFQEGISPSSASSRGVKTAGISNQHHSFLEGIQGGVLQADPGSLTKQGKVPLQNRGFTADEGGQVQALSKRHQTAEYQGETPQAVLKTKTPRNTTARSASITPKMTLKVNVCCIIHTSITRLQTFACCLIPLLIVFYSCTLKTTSCFKRVVHQET